MLLMFATAGPAQVSLLGTGMVVMKTPRTMCLFDQNDISCAFAVETTTWIADDTNRR